MCALSRYVGAKANRLCGPVEEAEDEERAHKVGLCVLIEVHQHLPLLEIVVVQ